jgi:hypothetical protein
MRKRLCHKIMMITIQIVLHMRALNQLCRWLSERARRKVEGKMIVDVEDHRIASQADQDIHCIIL